MKGVMAMAGNAGNGSGRREIAQALVGAIASIASLGLPSSGPATRLFENVGRKQTPAGALP